MVLLSCPRRWGGSAGKQLLRPRRVSIARIWSKATKRRKVILPKVADQIFSSNNANSPTITSKSNHSLLIIRVRVRIRIRPMSIWSTTTKRCWWMGRIVYRTRWTCTSRSSRLDGEALTWTIHEKEMGCPRGFSNPKNRRQPQFWAQPGTINSKIIVIILCPKMSPKMTCKIQFHLGSLLRFLRSSALEPSCRLGRQNGVMIGKIRPTSQLESSDAFQSKPSKPRPKTWSNSAFWTIRISFREMVSRALLVSATLQEEANLRSVLLPLC